MSDPVSNKAQGMGEDKAYSLIAAERLRQISEEGWTPEHDDAHDDGSLLLAGIVYLHHGTDLATANREDGVPRGWPWDTVWWKPRSRAKNLIRAGALCIAEQDRCVRANLPTEAADRELRLCVVALSMLPEAA